MPVLSYTPKPVNSPRDKYFAALTKARAAEAEYLAAEAVRREEVTLRRRLGEIQLQKEEQELLRSQYDCPPHYSPRPLMDLGAHPSYTYDSFAPLRRQVEAKDYLRILSVRPVEAKQEYLCQAEEACLLSLRQEREEALAAAFLERRTTEARHCICHKQLKNALPHHSAFLCPAAKSFAIDKFTSAKPKLQMQPSAEDDVQDLLTQLLVSQAERSKLNEPFGSRYPTGKTPTQSPDILEQFANLFGLSAKVAREQCTWQAPSQVVPSLKEKLVSRSINESSFEVSDTIQAVFSSLQGTESCSTPSSSTASDLVGTYEGKAKAQPSNTPASDSPATSQDVAKSMNEVRKIEATFQALVTNFTFPPQLDFLATHLVSDSSASSDSEASATAHLAYTSRNHAIRSYEHALSKLLTQLDAVDSFGDDGLRATRKEVVKRVEKTLEALEGEVEGRWRGSLFREANIEVTEPVLNETAAVPEQPTSPASEPAPSQNDSTVITDISKVMVADESTAKEDLSTFSSTAEADVAFEHSTSVSLFTAVTVEAATESNALAAEASDVAHEHPIVPVPRETQSIAQDAVVPPMEALVANDSDSAVSTQPSTRTEVPDTEDGIASASPQLAPSALAPKGFDVSSTTIEGAPSEDLESGEGFLLTTSGEVVSTLTHLNNREIEEDAGSDWSEVEA